MRVIVLSDRGPDGILFNGNVALDHVDGMSAGEETLAMVRSFGIDVLTGDLIAFPQAAAGHRLCRVAGDGIVRL